MAFLQSGGSVVGSAQIVDGSIVNADINAAAAIALTKLAGADGSGYNSSIINPNSLLYTSLALSSANILALNNTTTFTIVAAQGATKIILPYAYCVELYGGTASYINGCPTNIGLNGIAGNFFASNTAAAAFTSGAGSHSFNGDCTLLTVGDLRNKALEFRGTNATLFSGGDRLAVVHVWYRIITVN